MPAQQQAVTLAEMLSDQALTFNEYLAK